MITAGKPASITELTQNTVDEEWAELEGKVRGEWRDQLSRHLKTHVPDGLEDLSDGKRVDDTVKKL